MLAVAIEPWGPRLTASLTAREQVSTNGMHVTTTYTLVPGHRDDLIEALADLVQFLATGSVEAADPSSWRTGGRTGAATWERLVSIDDSGIYAEMKAAIGEAIAWWHETEHPEIVHAQRPYMGVGQPYVDSLSIMQCGDDQFLRGVQAKVTRNLPRDRIHEALGKFERLQAGERDDFLSETVRRWRAELEALGTITVDLDAASTGLTMRHFQTFVCHGRNPPGDPAHDYHPRLTAHAYHGRSLALVRDGDIDQLAAAVARLVRDRVLQ